MSELFNALIASIVKPNFENQNQKTTLEQTPCPVFTKILDLIIVLLKKPLTTPHIQNVWCVVV